MSQIPLGRFVAFDYVTAEPRAAQAFYATLFGWTQQRFTTPLAMRDAPQHAHWLPLLQTPSAHDSAARVKTLGGMMLREPFPVDGRGKQAIALDPAGNAIALWEPTRAGEDRSWPGTPGAICWAELYTSSPTTSNTFYRQLAGFSETRAVVAENVTYYLYDRDGLPRAGVRRPMPDMATGWFPWVRVADVDGVVAQALRLGAQVVRPPADMVTGTRMALFRDPQGASLGLVT